MTYGPVIREDVCTRCNSCVDGCPMDVIARPAGPEEIPQVRYPDECWYCGSCIMVCPTSPRAVNLVHPLDMRLALRRVK
ncbi:MAG: ferredoxin family protein [Desulfobacterales bacterium]|nr:ferredoxin family protein [Desulfobacterales bacterium]